MQLSLGKEMREGTIFLISFYFANAGTGRGHFGTLPLPARADGNMPLRALPTFAQRPQATEEPGERITHLLM